jgi:hypothetical protein
LSRGIDGVFDKELKVISIDAPNFAQKNHSRSGWVRIVLLRCGMGLEFPSTLWNC